MNYYYYRTACLCPLGGALPDGARHVTAPFSPLVFLVDRDPSVSRGIFRITSSGELVQPDGPGLLLPALPVQPVDAAVEAVLNQHGACVLNTAFSNCFTMLERFLHPKTEGFRLHLLGLGDVGGALLAGLCLLGEDVAEIGIYDPCEPLCQRYCLEMNQLLPTREGRVMPRVTSCGEDSLFDCDAVLFAASAGVPAVGSSVQDVRMAQLEANRVLLTPRARQARDSGFRGLFCQISDPVDQLSRHVFLESNRDDHGALDYGGLLPEQVQGFGLGVMRARAVHAAAELGVDASQVTAYGPHGAGLVVANAPISYDEELSQTLTTRAVTANLRVRELGFKPYLAPALSSACVSILAALSGGWYQAAFGFGGCSFGCTGRMTRLGLELRREQLHPDLFSRVQAAHSALREGC